MNSLSSQYFVLYRHSSSFVLPIQARRLLTPLKRYDGRTHKLTIVRLGDPARVHPDVVPLAIDNLVENSTTPIKKELQHAEEISSNLAVR